MTVLVFLLACLLALSTAAHVPVVRRRVQKLLRARSAPVARQVKSSLALDEWREVFREVVVASEGGVSPEIRDFLESPDGQREEKARLLKEAAVEIDCRRSEAKAEVARMREEAKAEANELIVRMKEELRVSTFVDDGWKEIIGGGQVRGSEVLAIRFYDEARKRLSDTGRGWPTWLELPTANDRAVRASESRVAFAVVIRRGGDDRYLSAIRGRRVLTAWCLAGARLYQEHEVDVVSARLERMHRDYRVVRVGSVE